MFIVTGPVALDQLAGRQSDAWETVTL